MNKLYVKALEDLAHAQKNRIASYINHAGEKGRLNEHVVVDLLKQICPKKFSVGTGFIISSYQSEPSPQCDIVIFDDFHNRPLFGESAANIYPVECVYAFVEVKTDLSSTEFKTSLGKILKIRTMAKMGKHYKAHELVWVSDEKGDISPASIDVKSSSDLCPRSFIFAFTSSLSKDIRNLTDYLRLHCDENHKHFHGLLILDRNLFIYRRPNTEPAEFSVHETDGLKAFIHMFVESIRSLPMGPMDLDRYLKADERS